MELFERRTAPKRADTWFVYALVDSRSPEEIRYIGITNNPKARLSLHLSQAPKEGWKKSRWISSVVNANGAVLMGIIATGLSQDDAMTMEIKLIADHRAIGSRLMNLTDGGDGVKGQVQSAETRAKKSAALKGRPKSPEAVAKQADAVLGRKATDKTKANMSAAHVKRHNGDPGLRQRISDALSKHYEDPSEREKISAANRRRYSKPGEREKTGASTRAAKIVAPPSSNNSSGFKGVSLIKRTGKWAAYISVNGVRIHLGHHATATDAAEAYDRAAIMHLGNDCYLNMAARVSC